MRGKAVDIIDVEMKFHRRAAEPIRADGAEVGIFVGEEQPLPADDELGVADAPVAGFNEAIDLGRTEGGFVEFDGPGGIACYQMRAHSHDFSGAGHDITLTRYFYYVTVRFIMSQAPEANRSPKRGRPRSEESRAAILRAAHDILMAGGLGRLTIEAVAERARVGKPTIYRYWKNAQELAMAALMAGEPQSTSVEPLEGSKLRLHRQMENLLDIFASTRGRQIALTMAAADPDSEMAKAFRTRVMLQQREEGRAILADAAASGEIRLQTDVETILDMLYAPVFYRLLVGHLPLTPAFGRDVVDSVWRGLTGKP